jgi:hypothetical protein
MVVPGSILLAQAAQPKPGWEFPVLWTSLFLCAALLVGAVVIAVVDRWRKQKRDDQPRAGDQLSQFRSLYERGKMSREEFERVKALLGKRMRKELQVPAPPAPPAEAAQPPEPPQPPPAPPEPGPPPA